MCVCIYLLYLQPVSTLPTVIQYTSTLEKLWITYLYIGKLKKSVYINFTTIFCFRDLSSSELFSANGHIDFDRFLGEYNGDSNSTQTFKKVFIARKALSSTNQLENNNNIRKLANKNIIQYPHPPGHNMNMPNLSAVKASAHLFFSIKEMLWIHFIY